MADENSYWSQTFEQQCNKQKSYRPQTFEQQCNKQKSYRPQTFEQASLPNIFMLTTCFCAY